MMMNPLLWLVLTAIDIYFWIVLATVVLSWLLAFNIVNSASPIVRQVNVLLRRLTEPLLAPIRRFLPDLGGIDVSPLILIIGLLFLRNAVIWLFYSMA